jgi:hypothetical protein
MKIFSACVPNRSTLATSGTRSRRERARSANSRISSGVKPSEVNAKIEP